MSISVVSAAVIKMLRAGIPPLLRAEQIGLCIPSENTDKYLLGVFIYAISRDMKAQMNGNLRIDKSSSVRAPLNVEMGLAITSYAGKKSGLLDDYRLLERVLQIWHDSSELPVTTELQPSVVTAPRIELLNLEQDEITKIWQFGNVPYSVSLFYKIAPIAISSHVQIKTSPVGSMGFSEGGL